MRASSIPPPPVEAGQHFGPYELLSPIGQGGMATVWLARRTGTRGFQKLVALKMVLPEHASDREFQSMLHEEARLASGIDHPHVARIFDLGEESGRLFLVMEYVAGEPLSHVRRSLEKRGHQLPIDILLRILADVCGGLHAAHELCDKHGHPLHIVHRDVSPQNILLADSGVAKLIDFGIAKAKNSLVAETASGIMKGKLKYMAPEQALARSIDRRADVFAIGAILFEFFEGRGPYDGGNDVERIQELVLGKNDIQMGPSVPEPIAVVIRRAVSRDPQKRFPTALDLRKELEAASLALGYRVTTEDIGTFLLQTLGEKLSSRRSRTANVLGIADRRTAMSELLARNAALDAEREATTGSSPQDAQDAQDAHEASLDGIARTGSHKTRTRKVGVAIAATLIAVGAACAIGLGVRARAMPKTSAASTPPPPAAEIGLSPFAPTTTTASASASASAIASAPIASASAVPPAMGRPPPPKAVPKPKPKPKRSDDDEIQ